MRIFLVVWFSLAGCKRQDPHERPATGSAAAPVVAGDVPAGSLASKSVEVWFALLLPEPPTPQQLGLMQEAARGLGVEVNSETPPVGRWVEIKPSGPRDAGFDPAAGMPNLRGIDETEVPGLQAVRAAIVVGAGGPTAQADAIHKDLAKLLYEAAAASGGWILDEQSYVVYDPEAFADGPMRLPRDVQQTITIYIDEQPDGTAVMTTGGLDRFGLPELRLHADVATQGSDWTDALDDAAQALIDHGGLDTAGVLQGSTIAWRASWGVAEKEGARLIELTAQ